MALLTTPNQVATLTTIGLASPYLIVYEIAFMFFTIEVGKGAPGSGGVIPYYWGY